MIKMSNFSKTTVIITSMSWLVRSIWIVLSHILLRHQTVRCVKNTF